MRARPPRSCARPTRCRRPSRASPPPPRRRPRRRRQRGSSRVALIQKRIGLLFAAFLALLAIAAVRAMWLGTVQAGSLRSAAVTQQDARQKVPARRGEIVDRRGVELAVTEPAEDVSATPYLIKDPNAVAKRIAPL